MPSIRIAIQRTVNFLNTTYNWIQAGGKPVDTELAIKRSKICEGCEFNRQDGSRGRCPACFARGAVLALFGFRQGSGKNVKFHKELLPMTDNPHNGKLTYCKKCGCDLRLKVFIPLGVIENDGVDYPAHCWQNPNIHVKLINEKEDGEAEEM